MATKTIEITDFTGRLTRVINGDINSGFAKFATSWGYDPFSKPGNLTWNCQPTDIKGSVITGTVLTGMYSFLDQFIFLDDDSKLYKVNTANDSVNPDVPVQLGTTVGSGSYNYGADIIGGITPLTGSGLQSVLGTSDTKIFRFSSDGTSSSVIGTFANTGYGVSPHPMVQFLGKTYAGDGNNLWEITGLTVTNTAVLTPPLPTNIRIVDLDLTPEGDYMVITTTRTGVFPLISTAGSIHPVNSAESYLFYWNGSDPGITAVKTLPSFPTSAFIGFLDKQYTTQQDTFGAALYEGNTKLLTLPNNSFPASNALISNGNFLSWTSPEATTTANTCISLYYFGQLDEQNPAGLFRMLRITPTTGRAYTSAYNGVINDFYREAGNAIGWGKHYISTHEVDGAGNAADSHFYKFVLNPGASTNPVLGVYETQTQLFSKRVGIAQIRVYTEPTITGNSFQLDIIGADGTPVPNGTFTYTFGQIVDPQSGSTSVERINFNSDAKTLYSIGIRITNLGSTQMTIKKIELDISETGK